MVILIMDQCEHIFKKNIEVYRPLKNLRNGERPLPLFFWHMTNKKGEYH